MELIKHRVAHYWSHRAEGFETQRLREYESAAACAAHAVVLSSAEASMAWALVSWIS